MSDDKTHAAEHAAQAAQFAAIAAGSTPSPQAPGTGPGFQFPQMPNYGQSYGQPQQHPMTIPTWW